ncbi:M28 family metallopeptidase [Cellulophaga sp. 20_2_10]|uniref:M28 family peptidase n=1 Tax=Cellulophaga sp. 20_2_10 TaxID=2942476 RepID=UPI00201A823B|nr:M28 family peptidase [Cellulophaga sp. 20_2_10]MCL5246402.1 M28 family metallopeptidase [Cellulophaga sp. 20_2_10]
MYKKIASVLILVAIVSCKTKSTNTTVLTGQNTVENNLADTDYTEIITTEFTGELAYSTTAFVEKYWRVVGNTGFNASIHKIAKSLEKAGYVLQEKADENTILTYRIEERPLENPTWESIDATLTIKGDDLPLLQNSTNSNMIALNSYSTPEQGVTAEVIYIDDVSKLKDTDVKGKIVFVETSPARVFNTAIVKGGAAGILSYNNPDYLQPEKNTTSIQFRSIPQNKDVKGWAIALSYAAKEKLKKRLQKEKVIVTANIKTNIYPSTELTLVADIKGAVNPEQRLVYSAHVQEPGANDNATGVGVALEMATITAKLIKEGKLNPKRTLTFLWGDEIVSTRRYVQEDKIRAKNIKWGISLDMVGENTAITGGSFLIEKMPDPSAIWTRGNDKHTEWGGSVLSLKQMKPHYLNDFVLKTFKEQGKRTNWEVNSNPYEGGSDHTPFLDADIPGVLFWHFTDQFYHTDNDRLDKVSKTTLKNVGTAALISAYKLLNADENTAKTIILDIEKAAISRLQEELKQGKIALAKGEKLETQIEIINAWQDWYAKAINSTLDMVINASTINATISKAKATIKQTAEQCIAELKK